MKDPVPPTPRKLGAVPWTGPGPADWAVVVEEATLAETLPLRAAVLRPGGEPAAMGGDDDPATLHLAARTPDGRVVGVVRFSPAPCPWRPDVRGPWQLRGMATDPAVQGSGVGRALVAAGLDRVAARGGDLVWCDARVSAAGFYERMGFAVVTEPYEKPPAGRHLGMLVDPRRAAS
jgi:ribosomal protein S18 acetylase RimI-like enzyme